MPSRPKRSYQDPLKPREVFMACPAATCRQPKTTANIREAHDVGEENRGVIFDRQQGRCFICGAEIEPGTARTVTVE